MQIEIFVLLAQNLYAIIKIHRKKNPLKNSLIQKTKIIS